MTETTPPCARCAARAAATATAPRLPPRCLDVLRLAAMGLTSRQTATRLHISPYTVYAHREKIRRTYNANTMIQAVAEAIRTGPID